jgi:hypothetical protein
MLRQHRQAERLVNSLPFRTRDLTLFIQIPMGPRASSTLAVTRWWRGGIVQGSFSQRCGSRLRSRCIRDHRLAPALFREILEVQIRLLLYHIAGAWLPSL